MTTCFVQDDEYNTLLLISDLLGLKCSVYNSLINNYWMRFCDIPNNRGRLFLDITKTESNNCFIIH